MKVEQLEAVVEYKIPIWLLKWDDPDPIPGCNYRVSRIWDIDTDEGTAMIRYGTGSEAGVYISELRFLTPGEAGV